MTKVKQGKIFVRAWSKKLAVSLLLLHGRHLIPPGGGGGTPLLGLYGLYGDVPLDRVWFFGLAVLNRVYNLTCLCPKQGIVFRAERL